VQNRAETEQKRAETPVKQGGVGIVALLRCLI